MTPKSHDPDLVRRVPGILQLMDGSSVSSVSTALWPQPFHGRIVQVIRFFEVLISLIQIFIKRLA